MYRFEFTTIIEPANIPGSILTGGLMWVDSDWLLLKGKSRKALCGADPRHKKTTSRWLLVRAVLNGAEGRTRTGTYLYG